MRTFLSVNLDSDVLSEVSEIQRRLKLKSVDGIRWVAPERMHITLKFLGEVTQDQVIELEKSLHRPARRLSPFYISFRGIGAFPNPKKPRILWLGIEEGRVELQEIHKMIKDNLPFLAKDTQFTPHLTLGRSKNNAHLTLKDDLFSAEISCRNKLHVDRFYLMKSTLCPTGPVYEPLKKFFLNQ